MILRERETGRGDRYVERKKVRQGEKVKEWGKIMFIHFGISHKYISTMSHSRILPTVLMFSYIIIWKRKSFTYNINCLT